MGNNKAIAEAIAETLRSEGFEAETRYVKEVKKLDAKDLADKLKGEKAG
jgi:menaquinone-dependent protoporphyrinogen IX oxidase